jgi:hypothetical protein
MHLLTNEGTLGWWLGRGFIEIGPGLTGLYIQNVSPLNWLLHGQKRE